MKQRASAESGWLRRGYSYLLGVPAPDPVARRHAPSLLLLCGLGAVALVVGEFMRWRAGAVHNDLLVFALRMLGAVLLAVAFWLIRSGRFKLGVSVFVTGAVLISVLGVALNGFAANARALSELTMPLALAALLVGRRALWLSMLAYAFGFSIGGLRDAGYLWGTGPHPPPTMPFGEVGTAIVGFAVVSLVLDRVGLSLREGFELALIRQRDLEQTTAELAEANAALRAEMTRRQAAEAQLIEAQKMEAVSRLSGGIAHDFNNLLTVIIGATQFAQESLPPGSSIGEELDDVRQAADRAADLTRQLLAFARRQSVEPKILNVDERVELTKKLLGRLLREDIRLQTQLGSDGWYVRIDPGQLDQVLINFVVNARDAMPRGGPLSIRTSQVNLKQRLESPSFVIPAGDYVLLEVADAGTGMDKETRRRVFEPFFTTKGGAQGSGLGLATCYGIVLEAGGAILIDTEVGRGTTFRVYLPRSVRVGIQSGPTPKPSSDNARRGETVLVVEDETQVRKITIQILKRAGYRVLEAGNVAQAVHMVSHQEGPIDLLLTDLVLPDGSGGDVAERVFALRPGIRALYVSGYTDDPALRRGISEGELAFLSKPFSAENLIQRVREVLDAPARGLAETCAAGTPTTLTAE